MQGREETGKEKSFRRDEESLQNSIGAIDFRSSTSLLLLVLSPLLSLSLSSLSLSPQTRTNLSPKKKTISAEDVVNALADSGFEELAAPLRKEAESKRLAAKEAAAEKKRDRAEAAAAEATEAVPAAN